MAEGTRQLWAASGRLPEGLIYPELVHGGFTETLVQNSDLFNAASMNCLRLVPQLRQGDFAQTSFFKNVANLISRRSNAGSPENADVTSEPLPLDELISVKLNRRIGPVDQTLDAFRKIGQTDADFQRFSFTVGEQVAKAAEIEMLNSALRSVRAAIWSQSTQTVIDYGPENSPQGQLDTDRLIDALALFGDAGQRIKIWVMHSVPFYNLLRSQVALNLEGISNFNVAQATPITLGRPVLVTDSPALITTEGSPEGQVQYTTLGLVENGVVVEESELEHIQQDVITGKENLVLRLQGEYAYNIGVKGFAADVANIGVNPNDAALGTPGNWASASASPEVSKMDDIKDLAGVAINTTG